MTESLKFPFGTARRICVLSLAVLCLSACGGKDNNSSSSKYIAGSSAFKSEALTSRFLGRATFGAKHSDIKALTGTDVSSWMKAEFSKPASPYLEPLVEQEPNRVLGRGARVVPDHFFDVAIAGDDQLRQRMILALSEIIVISSESGIRGRPLTMAHYVQILSDNAFGNYRQLLEDISYSPAMAFYLTYMLNKKGDAASGRVPDENYAREILQLFSIGLKELNPDGTDKLDEDGNPIETYDNADVQGLAKVFTGMSTQGSDFFYIYKDFEKSYAPMVYHPKWHSNLEKSFLGVTIPAGTSGPESLEIALDTIFAHPNVGPFVSKQLIQRFVTSNPEPAYVKRVAETFDKGHFVLPDGSSVGTGDRGDLKATLAAILLDQEALRNPKTLPDDYGKIREPIIRLTQWARAFNENTPDAEDEDIFNYLNNGGIQQSPFRSPSVFNFFRPGYVAPATATGEAGLVAPELQITNEITTIGYINFINAFIYDRSYNKSKDPEGGIKADYSEALLLADEPFALIDYLDLLLTANALSEKTRQRISDVLMEIPIRDGSEDYDRNTRVRLATSMVMTSPGYVVQR